MIYPRLEREREKGSLFSRESAEGDPSAVLCWLLTTYHEQREKQHGHDRGATNTAEEGTGGGRRDMAKREEPRVDPWLGT